MGGKRDRAMREEEVGVQEGGEGGRFGAGGTVEQG